MGCTTANLVKFVFRPWVLKNEMGVAIKLAAELCHDGRVAPILARPGKLIGPAAHGCFLGLSHFSGLSHARL
jgi:hypothetical protein